MNVGELQAELRHVAADRDRQPLHTPKNLSTALMVEAAELAAIFQWMTPEASLVAHQDAALKARIGAGAADVLLRLLQVADRCRVDLERAVRDPLTARALEHPGARAIATRSPPPASAPGTHVLLDFENVQPTEEELRALVPDARHVWVFHGPHQREVKQRFASFDDDVTAVPISKTGKNALDFHLSFYMGYIASRNPTSAMVVVADDKGYEPMLEHARAMGFAVRRLACGRPRVATPRSRTAKAPARQAVARKAAAQPAAARPPAAPKVAAKAAAPPAARKTPAGRSPPAAVTSAPRRKAVAKAPVPVADVPVAETVPAANRKASRTVAQGPAAPTTGRRLTEHLRKLGDQRPTKLASLRRWLKSILGSDATDKAVDQVLDRLAGDGVVAVDAAKGVSYPRFEPVSGRAVSRG